MRAVYSSPDLAPCPPVFNMAAYVLQAGLDCPEKTALEIWDMHAAERYSFGDIRALVLTAATALRGAGITVQDRVLMRLSNELAFPITYLATLWLGAVPVPTSAQLTTPEITRIAAQVRPNLIVASPKVALPAQNDTPILNTADLFAPLKSAPPEAHIGDPNRLGYIIFTSGTTQGPRGVCHAHRAIWARQMMFDAWYGLTPDDRLLHAGAFNWTYTLGTGLMDPWTLGATAIIPGQGLSSGDIATLVAASDASIFAAAPGVYRQILKRDTMPATPKLRHGLSAGEKLAPSVKAKWKTQTGTDIHEALGMSECSTFISGSPGQPACDHQAGWPQPGRKVAVLDGQGAPVDHDMPGVLGIAKTDPGLCLGYLDAALEAGDWFLTGDTVSMAEDGAITYLGRDDDMINAGGFRVSPVEIEAAFTGFEGIAEAAALAVSPKADTHVIALVYSSPQAVPDDQLRAHAHRLLARYKQPRLYIHRAVLPKGANGKLSRKSLRSDIEGIL